LLALATGTVAAALKPSSLAAAGLTPQAYFSAALIGASYLEDAARIGAAKGRNPRLVAFARAELAHQTRLAARLNDAAEVAAWGVGKGGSGAVNPVSGSVVGAGLGALVAGPAGAAIGLGIGATTGAAGASRSASLPGLPDDRRRAALIAALNRQEAGPAFDALFVQVQTIAQQDALQLHDGYAAVGTDERLRRVARAEAATIRRRLADLAALQRLVG
jgi:predicted outer membrane protein